MGGVAFRDRRWSSRAARFKARARYLGVVDVVDQLSWLTMYGHVDPWWDEYPPEFITRDEIASIIDGAGTMQVTMHDTKCVGLVDGASHSFIDPEKRSYPHKAVLTDITYQDGRAYVEDLSRHSVGLDPDSLPPFFDADGNSVDSDGNPWDKRK